MSLKLTFSQVIGRERVARGWTQAQVAEMISVSLRWYQQLESGRYLPSATVMLRLLALFELDAAIFKEDLELVELLYKH